MFSGISRYDLKCRYDVSRIDEDEWHSYSGKRTLQFLSEQLAAVAAPERWLLNAGAGVYGDVGRPCHEVSVDLFQTPLNGRENAVCANVERLPFRDGSFHIVICVGEVLAYCDPSAALSEFSRLLISPGILICDFGSSRSFRYLLSEHFGRAAEIVTEDYNGAPERTWRYDPAYILSLLEAYNLKPTKMIGTHTWSALAERVGLNRCNAISVQRACDWIPLPKSWADVITLAAVKSTT